MSGRSEFAEVKVLLQAQIGALAMHLAPGGYKAGKYWMARNPTRDDRQIGSFWISLTGVPGAWRDEATGDKGDVWSLIKYVLSLDNKGALAWAKSWLGVGPKIDEKRVALARREVDRIAEVDQRLAAERLSKARNQAFSVFLNSWDNLEGTVAQTYLMSRGIDIRKLARPARALRYIPNADHVETRSKWPVLIGLMTGPTEAPWAVHRTFLARDGAGKASVVPARKIWPSFSGGAIRLARGETGLTPKEAAAKGQRDRLLICEGVEDGLSVALACPELRVWAAGTLGNVAHLVLPDCCAEVIVAADNDWGKPQAEKLLKRGLEALAAQGRPVRVARSPVGKDINDALRGAA